MLQKKDYSKFLLIVVPLFLIVPLLGCYSAAANGTLSIYAASGSKPAIDEICMEFERQYGIDMEITYGGGGEILSQIELTHTGDIYIAPEQKFMETARQKELIASETLRSVAYMVPVIAVRKDNPKHITALADLARPDVRVAITRPETTLLGKYAPEIFKKAGLAEAIGKNVVTHTLSPDSLLTMLILDQLDAGIIWHFYKTQTADQIEIIWLEPEQLTGIGEIQIATTTFSNDMILARQLIDFVTSEESKAILEKNGYVVDIEEVDLH